jgi:hypothetical protein
MPDSTLNKIVGFISTAETPPELRRAALRVAGAVGSSKDRALVKALLAVLEENDPELRALAVEALGQLRVEEVLPHLEALVRHGGVELEAAVRTASQLGVRGARLMGKLMSHVLPPLRSRIADILARSGTGNALVVTAQGLLDHDPKVVDATARSLAAEVPSYNAGQRSALVKFLGEALQAKDHELTARSEAAVLRVLGALHEGKAADIFWARLTPGSAVEVRAAALQALGAQAEPDTEAKLQRLLACAADTDFQIVATALMILRNVPVSPKQTRNWLKLLEAPDVATRRFAVEKLRGVEKDDVAQALAVQLEHPDRALREEALTALLASACGREAVVERLLQSDHADAAWGLARALALSAGDLPDAQRTRLFEQALAYQDADDRRAAPLWFLLREAGPAWVRDQLEEKAQALRKKKKYAEAMQYYRLLAQDPACGEDLRFDVAATGLKLSNHDLSLEHRGTDPTLNQFARLLQNPAFDVLGKLTQAKWLDAEDLFYLGFHFAEQSHRAKEFGRQVLEIVFKRSPNSEMGKQAKRKLKSEALA